MKKMYVILILLLLVSVATSCSVTNVYKCPPCPAVDKPTVALPHKATLSMSSEMGKEVTTTATRVLKKELFKSGIFIRDTATGDHLKVNWNLTKIGSNAQLTITISHDGKPIFQHITSYGVIAEDPEGWMAWFVSSFYGPELNRALKTFREA